METQKKLKYLLWVLWAGLIAALIALGIFLVLEFFVYYNGHFYRKNQEVLDVTGQSLTYEDYRALRMELPGTRLVWNAPLSGGSVPSDRESLTLQTLKREDLQLLSTFPSLREVDARGCTEYALLLELQSQKPDCLVRYQVTLGENTYDQDARSVSMPNPDAEQLEKLKYLPQVQTVYAGNCEDYPMLQKLRRLYPACQVLYKVPLGDGTYLSETVQAVVEHGTYAQLAKNLAGLPELETLTLLSPDATGQELRQLREDYPELTIHWKLEILGQETTDETEELDISGIPVEDLDALGREMEKLPKLQKLIMSDCGIDNETMAAFREEKREQYKVVWTVHINSWCKARTDDVYFMPYKQGYTYLKGNGKIQDLKYCEDMICVDVGHSLISDVSWAAYMPHLKYLVLAHTVVLDITPLGACKELVFLELDHSSVLDYSPLVGCTALEDLNLGKTLRNVTPILQMTWLKNLWWMDIGPSTRYRLSQALPNTRIVCPEKYTVGNGWRQLPNYYAMRDVLGMHYMS